MSKYTGQLLAQVTRVEPDRTVVEVVDPAGVPLHLRVHHMIHGSPNQVPVPFRKAGQRVLLEYRTSGSFGLWFIVGPA